MAHPRLHKIQRNMLARFPVSGSVAITPITELDEAAHDAADAAYMRGLGQTAFEREIIIARLGCVVADGVQVAAEMLGMSTAAWVNGAKRYALQVYFDRLRALNRTSNQTAVGTSKGRVH